MTELRTLVVGAGISGVTAGFLLERIPGWEYSVFERENSVGGLCRTISHAGFTYDTVSHVLHFRSERTRELVNELLPELMGVSRDSRVFVEGRMVPYPLQAHFGFLPLRISIECAWGLLRAKLKSNSETPPNNFSEWISQGLGAGIGRVFMVPYNEKLWGVPVQEMSTDWLGAFVPSVNMSMVLGSLLGRRQQLGYNTQFQYPRAGGIQSLVEALATRTNGIQYGRSLTRLNLKNRIARFDDGTVVHYEHLISSIPLTSLVEMTEDAALEMQQAASRLRSTSVLSLVFCLRRPLSHRHHWIYYPQAELPFFRLFFPSNVNPGCAPAGCSIIAAEISLVGQDQTELMVEKTLRSLQQLGMMDDSSEIVHQSCHYYRHGYPVHDLNREQVVTDLLRYYAQHGVNSIGRFGGWRYSSVSDAMEEAMNTVTALVSERDAFRATTS